MFLGLASNLALNLLVQPAPSRAPHRRQIVTASNDGTARIWIANIDDLLAEAARLIQRNPPRLQESKIIP